ncbi:DUF2971 domain-containing protein [Colwellia sp. MB02u-18]|uniref:DUF2971 domain-containing protein n=1 Tax=unclassified Colwellia TaxID=196834 RepID=UPI0015F6B74B|nr:MULTISPECIES: DUF2971 domain-containing protein [unclassified Colwellia]MBA6225055.1 DUF2971 domain-containing protein [Colwellia sp. MB3u-45]MBA6268657.1 DUF2971 domain-containing protein [Colwellia sp. MB3u-43]MBA6321088.1 DUF2971 domain-containing protein [Colwellia sp. MB02u-19]MBA6325641.1 DUF2971 domain-containing protein [Colwellia sp. MB02u-18]MBA6332116.1 DUF2971 domain-containing protein [Colwellia sp. MB02u-12]
MLVKYFGKVFNKELNTYSVRTDFLKNGLFRFTQPNQLNDKGSEFKLYPYFNEISPSDSEYAISKLKKDNWNSNSKTPNIEDLKIYLGINPDMRYDPATWKGLNGLPLAEMDESTWIKNTEQFNEKIINIMSANLGVFSLSTDDLNEHMWVMYASEGTGVAVEFDENHPFFLKNVPQTVSYLKNNRATYTYYNGIQLINGIKRKNYNIEKLSSTEMTDLFKRLALSKNELWFQEKEKRIIIDLNKASNSDIDHQLHSKYPGICLKEIPFEAFKSIIFGYASPPEFVDRVISVIKNNNSLSHICIKHVKHDHFGNVIYNDNKQKTR